MKKVLSVLLSASILAASLSTSLISMAKTEPELVGSSVSDWGAHNYVAVDGEAVTSALTPLPTEAFRFPAIRSPAEKGSEQPIQNRFIWIREVFPSTAALISMTQTHRTNGSQLH